MPQQVAFVVVPGNAPGQRIGLVTFNQPGYHVTDYDRGGITEERCKDLVHEFNAERNVSDEVAEAMLGGSMFGWNAPIAQPAVDYFTQG